jgi:pyruvate/2-oxoglutarate dehydrogenase complex dihydrolipoamide acyltransferase (E2) component
MPDRGLTPERILAVAGTAALLAVLLAILLMLGVGGGDGEQEAAAPNEVATETTEPDKEEAEETPEPEPTVPPLTREQRAERDAAAAAVRERGYEPQDLESYRGDHTLRVIFGEPLDGPEGTQRAFFFVDGEDVGSDAPDASGEVEIAKATENQVTLRYRTYEPTDDADQPTGETVRVRFRWDGTALQTLDAVPIPTERRPPGTA